MTQTELKNPVLRFPEFVGRGDYDWQVKRLGDITDTYAGLSGKTKKDFGSGKPYIQYKQVFEKSYIDINKCGLVNLKDDEKQNIVQYGDIIFTGSSETALEVGMSSVYLNNKEVYLNSFCFGLRPKLKDILYPPFSQFLFRSNTFRKCMYKLAQGSTRFNISKISLLKEKINLPHPDEQKQIADFLSVIDRRIGILQGQYDLLCTYKQGVMQQIFTQKIRFKQSNGAEYPDWQVKRLGDIGNMITGNTPPKKDLVNYENGLYNWATAKDFTEKYIKNTRTKLSEIGKNKARILPKGSVLITCIASIGLNAILKEDSAFNQQINGIIPNENYSGEFIYYLIEYNKKKLIDLAGTTAVPIINKSTFSNFSLMFASLDEQKQIADFLSAIDNKITTLNTQFTQTKQYKKSLMQKMFV